MTLDQFWNIIDEVENRSAGSMYKKCDLLDAKLRQLPLDEVRSFREHFDQCLYNAYSWELWAAAYIIGGGCSDDAFSDFRTTLISMGRATFEQTLADPQSLADADYDPDIAFFEGYGYVPLTVEKDLNGGQLFPRAHTHPEEPSGKPWDEDKVAEYYPKLAEKYGCDA